MIPSDGQKQLQAFNYKHAAIRQYVFSKATFCFAAGLPIQQSCEASDSREFDALGHWWIAHLPLFSAAGLQLDIKSLVPNLGTNVLLEFILLRLCCRFHDFYGGRNILWWHLQT